MTDANHPVEIYYGQPQYLDLNSMADGVGVKIYPEDKVQTFPDPSLGIGSKIVITRATAIYVTDAKKLTVYQTWQKTVRDLLKEKNIELLGQDSVDPSLDTWLRNNMSLTITRVAEVKITETEPIDFKTIKKNSVDLEKGQTQIQTKGVNGEKQVTYKIKRVDGVEVSRTVENTQVTKEPVTEVQIIGIGPKLAKSGLYKDTINAAVKSSLNKNYSVNGTALMCLMISESNGNADSIGRDSNDNPAYYGLFQYTAGFWAQASSGAGYGGASWSDPTAQIYTTVWALTHGYSGRWGGTWPACAGK